MAYYIRLATTADIPDLFAAEYALFPENNFNEKTLETEILQGLTWVAYSEVVLAGYCICRLWKNQLLDVLRLGVKEGFRRHGLGDGLLREALARHPKTMLTVRKGNEPAINLYKKHGFQITGTLPQHYSWVMRRDATTTSS